MGRRHRAPRRSRARGVALAVVERGARGLVVRAASGEARAEGVTIGLRRREAEARCAGLVVVDADPTAEAPGLRSRRPCDGADHSAVSCSSVRGCSRSPPAGRRATSVATPRSAPGCSTPSRATGVADARIGVADGAFAARLAARTAGAAGVRVVAPGGSARVPRAVAGVGARHRPRGWSRSRRSARAPRPPGPR